MDSFPGFAGAVRFLRALQANNDKAWFDAHRSDYESDVVEPAKAFVAEAGDQLRTQVSPTIAAEPRVNGSIFRLNRDIRFSADKTPYKDHLAFFFWDGPDRKTSPGCYLQIRPDELLVGLGSMGPIDLDRWRAAVADDGSGAALDDSIAAANTAGEIDWGEPALKRVPKPYPADHPRADLLRQKMVHAGRTVPHPAELAGPEFVDWTADAFVPFADLLAWMRDQL